MITSSAARKFSQVQVVNSEYELLVVRCELTYHLHLQTQRVNFLELGMLSSRNPWQLREIASLENVCWSCFLRGGRNTRSLVTNAALGNGFMHRNESRRSRTTIKRKPSAFPVSHLSNRKFCTKLNGRVVRSRNRTGSATQQKVSPPLQDQREFSNGRTDLERSRNSLTTIRTSAPFGLRHGASTTPTGLRASSTLPCISKHLSESGTYRYRFGPQSRTKTTHMSQAVR